MGEHIRVHRLVYLVQCRRHDPERYVIPRHFPLGGEYCGAACAAVNNEDMIKVDQFFYGRHRLGRIACGVLIHDLELAAIDAAVSIRVFVQSDSPIVYGVSPQAGGTGQGAEHARSEEHTSELQSLMRISYAVFCW